MLYHGGDDLSKERSCELLGKHEGGEKMVGEGRIWKGFTGSSASAVLVLLAGDEEDESFSGFL